MDRCLDRDVVRSSDGRGRRGRDVTRGGEGKDEWEVDSQVYEGGDVWKGSEEGHVPLNVGK